jgi:DNA mismatch endonuclease (patch repair protein)
VADRLSPSDRSRVMAGIRSRDTGPEIVVRRVLHANGYRFRLGGCGLPGRPDVVLPRHRTVVRVHGCFWHQHKRCRTGRRVPQSNPGYWVPKLARNVARDRRDRLALRRLGWRVVTVWECEIRRDPVRALRRAGMTL